MVCLYHRDAVISIQCVLLWFNDQNQSAMCCMFTQHRLSISTVHHVLANRRLGLEHHMGHGFCATRLLVLPICVRFYYN